MRKRLIFEPLSLAHAEGLGELLLNEHVYRYLGGQPPSADNFLQAMKRVLDGPPPHRSGDEWINYAVRLQASNGLLGRVEATVHDGIAEVAFLFGPQHWGKGYAAESLQWLDALLLARSDRPALWATTVPGNLRCQALLLRCGYHLATEWRPPRLVSYDDGDLVFHRSVAGPLRPLAGEGGG